MLTAQESQILFEATRRVTALVQNGVVQAALGPDGVLHPERVTDAVIGGICEEVGALLAESAALRPLVAPGEDGEAVGRLVGFFLFGIAWRARDCLGVILKHAPKSTTNGAGHDRA